YSSYTAKGYLVSNVKLNSSKCYVVDFTFRANPSAYIFQASGVIPSCTDVSAINNKTIDNSAFKIRPYSGKNLNIDAASYYSDPECTKILGSALDAEATTAAMTRQEDIRVKLLIKNGEWEYGEVSISGKTYYVKTYFAENKTDAKRTGWTNYFGFQSWNAADVVFKNLTISECAKGSESTSFATVICGGNTYRVAAGTEIDPSVYSRGAVAVLCDGAYSLGTTPKATAGKTYEIISQSENTFVSPMFAGSTKYYGKNILQTVDFASIENDADLAAAGMVYLDAADNSYGITYSNEGLHYRTGNNEGFLISNVKMSENETYIVDFTVAADPSARVFVASAAFPDRETISEEVGAYVDARAFKLRLLSESMLASDGAKYYTDPACTALFGDGSRPDVAAQEAAVTNQKDVRVRLLFTGGTWQYGEVIVEGQTYYLKATTARTEQNGYFGFAGFGSVEVLFKNLTIFECEKNPSGHSFVKVGDKLYRAPESQTLSAVDYAPNGKKTVVFKDNGTYSQTVNTKSGGVYAVMSLDDVNLRSVGASVRLKTDSGLRFATSIDKDDVAFLDELKAQGQITSYSYGTIITYAKYAKELGGVLTHAALDSFAREKGIENSYVDVGATAWYRETEDSYIFVGSIVSIDSENYGREYAPSGYLTVSMADGNTFTVYTEYSSVNVRSVSYVAACAYYDDSVGYDEAQAQMLTSFIGDRKYKTVAIDGVCEYTVVYDAENEESKESAYAVAEAFAAAGIQLSVESDAALIRGKAIYIGATSHALSKASEAYYINSQISCDDSGNIAVTGNLEVGIPRLIQKIRGIEYSLSKTLLLEDTFMGIFAEEGFGNAPKYTGGGVEELKYSFDKSNSYYILIHDATLTDYNKYLAKLVGEGYECYHSTTANGQKFDTYTDGYNILTLSYVAYYDPRTNADKIYDTPSNGNVKYMTIAIDCVEKSALPERSPDIADIATEQLSTVETQCGYLLRLQDGRFVVFDGGYTAENAKALYDMIVDQNVREGKPVIAAWFITHAHPDHYIGIVRLCVRHADEF
ncbi:MAG: MBL fold metallo-hydrolase, partial [Clostridia bacterium]|nr:MBL fold metallo-hydrolase [Clostridia bacterium]